MYLYVCIYVYSSNVCFSCFKVSIADVAIQFVYVCMYVCMYAGFGHGRLQGRELELMEKKLRHVATVLAEEAQAQSLET